MGRKKSKSYTYRVSLTDDYKKKPKDKLIEDVVDFFGRGRICLSFIKFYSIKNGVVLEEYTFG